LVSRFIGKKIAFKKKDNDTTFVGKLLEVTETSMLLEFNGQLQVHSLADIVEMCEGIDKREKDGD